MQEELNQLKDYINLKENLPIKETANLIIRISIRGTDEEALEAGRLLDSLKSVQGLENFYQNGRKRCFEIMKTRMFYDLIVKEIEQNGVNNNVPTLVAYYNMLQTKYHKDLVTEIFKNHKELAAYIEVENKENDENKSQEKDSIIKQYNAVFDELEEYLNRQVYDKENIENYLDALQVLYSKVQENSSLFNEDELKQTNQNIMEASERLNHILEMIKEEDESWGRS